ncbi:hypothetical protein [Pseudotabrizicola algicola]|uniref:Uncharacterized protein n=1 Tax=Pseudotabrizicola algicola TaxID=2709381 RepID=A0A6B3RGX6_9RHOB|nr:hypothetical protein [Pseudotabrizicola algicola]NEX45220.1 hypothetical protein [Pseudotabrizicola algicola]
MRVRIASLAVAFALVASAAVPQTIIENDPGGSLVDRLTALASLRQTGHRVEIVGWCASACTLYLGLPGACVRPSARLGFHGPQSQFYGVSLPPDDFEHWSRVMADHYPPQLRAWFMRDARNTTMGVVQITGAQAIQLGARQCLKGGGNG